MTKLRRTILSWTLLAPLIAVILLPFWVMFVTAVKPPEEVLNPSWWPSRFRWSNFLDMWSATGFGVALLNSLAVALMATAGAILVAVPAAYAMSRFAFRLRGAVRQLFLVSQMLSPIVLVIGLFRLLVMLGVVESIWAVGLVYAAFNIAFAVWMLTNYFNTLPRDLEEAAWIDGASRARTVTAIFLPLAMPAIAVTAIFTFIAAWNEFVIALTLLRRQETYTLPIQVFSLVAGRYTVEWNHVMAATLVATLPVAILFIWLQRHLVRGLAVGAVK